MADVRAQNLSASVGATDFGAYFLYFSFFLVVSAILLAALFFRLSVEQRLPEIGLLRAEGYDLSTVRRLFMLEAALVSAGLAWEASRLVGQAAIRVDVPGRPRRLLEVARGAKAVVGPVGPMEPPM